MSLLSWVYDQSRLTTAVKGERFKTDPMRGIGRWRIRLCLHSVSLFEFLFARPTTAVKSLALMKDLHGWIFGINLNAADSAFVSRHVESPLSA